MPHLLAKFYSTRDNPHFVYHYLFMYTFTCRTGAKVPRVVAHMVVLELAEQLAGGYLWVILGQLQQVILITFTLGASEAC